MHISNFSNGCPLLDGEQIRFYYSFTCKENLSLVMEYLNGGDLYSLLRNLGCLDEDMARVYIAELVNHIDLILSSTVFCYACFVQ